MIIEIVQADDMGYSATLYTSESNKERLYSEIMTAYYPTPSLSLNKIGRAHV